MKIVSCKRCTITNLFWRQDGYGRWLLLDADTRQVHKCEDGNLKPVTCKYCGANDLHWAEERNPNTGTMKAVLTESYGLPHACDERLAFVAAEKQKKKNEYEAEKKRILAIPDGNCAACNGTGRSSGSFGLCSSCCGCGVLNERTRRTLLYVARSKIWPNINKY